VSKMQTRLHATWGRIAVAISLCTMLHALPATAQGTTGSVMNSTFTSAIDDGAPVDFRQGFDTNTPVVYYFTEILDLHGQTVIHRWKLEGKVMQEVPIAVKRSRQAVWSKSTMQPDWTGNWIVEVVNARGEVIEMDNFSYSPPM
jgi:hypothetical protein